MDSKQKGLYKKADEILWNDWDSIGVNDSAPRDEYQSYVLGIYEMLIENKTEKEIAELLNHIATNSMGLFGNLEHCKMVSKKLIDSKQ